MEIDLMMKSAYNRLEIIVGKGENTSKQGFLNS